MSTQPLYVMVTKGDNFYDFLFCLHWWQNSFRKWSAVKGEFALRGLSNFCLSDLTSMKGGGGGESESEMAKLLPLIVYPCIHPSPFADFVHAYSNKKFQQFS